MPNQGETLLRVEHLCQYFKSTKAVDDVSFEIKKGEVFGLVGESGCGKTTTGRSIIKLYDITSGDIYFKGKRIAAGVGSYKKNITAAKKKFEEESAALKASGDSAKISEKKKELAAQKREAHLFGKLCLRCNTPMVKMGARCFQMYEYESLTDSIFNPSANTLLLDVMYCQQCRKVEFFLPEEET